MSKTVNPANESKLIIKDVVVSYVHILRPWAANQTGEPKYSLVIVVPKSDTKQVAAIKSAISAAYTRGKKDVWGDKSPSPAALKHPLRDGDVERPDDPVFEGAFFMNASAKNRPGIIDLNNNDLTEPGREEEVYSGMIAHVSVNFYPYDAAGNRGIACGLNNVLKVKDGTFLGGRSTAENDFAEFLNKEEEEKTEGTDVENDIFK